MRFKRFTKPSFLRQIGRGLLGQFFNRFKDELAARNVQLPSPGMEDEAYFKALARVAMEPDGLPDEMIEGLYTVEGVANPEGQERLERAEAQGLLQLGGIKDASHGEIAMQAYLSAPGVVEEKNNELLLTRLCSFEYYGSKSPTDRSGSVSAPSCETLNLVTGDLDGWFKEHNRGERTTRVELYPIDGEWWFMIRHGDTFARVARLDRGRFRMLHFRPAKDDVVVYSPERDEIRIHAGTKGETEIYRKTFGMRLFDDDEYFSERKAYTLEPLRIDGAAALSVDGLPGIERIVLREIETAWGGGYSDVTVRKSDDIFASAESSGGKRSAIPAGGRLVRAAFDFYFVGSKKPRKVQVRPPNILKLGRRCDAALVHRWLSLKGLRATVGAGMGAAPFPLPILPPPARGVEPIAAADVVALGEALQAVARRQADGGLEVTAAE